MKISQIIKIAILCGLLLFVFWQTFSWMHARFDEPESFYAHGYLVPFVCAYLIFAKKEELAAARLSSSRWGAVLLGVCLFTHIFAAFFEINFLSAFAFWGALIGLTAFNCGGAVLRICAFSLFFVLFMIPLPKVMIMGLSFYLKIFCANAASAVMARVIPLENAGGLVYLPNGVLTVGAPCSGLKSLISLSALSLLFGHISGFRLKKLSLFFVCSLPVAIISNIFRIMLLILVYYVYGAQIAMGWFHDFSGMLVFVFAFIGLVLIRKVFQLCCK